MSAQNFLHVYPVSSQTRWVGVIAINGTVDYRYMFSLEDQGFLKTAEEAVHTGLVHAEQLGLKKETLTVQVFSSYEEYSGMEVFV